MSIWGHRKKMNKQIAIVVAMVLLFVGLSGCNEINSNGGNPLKGTWTGGQVVIADYGYGIRTIINEFTFTDYSVYLTIINNQGIGIVTHSTQSGTYEIQGNRLLITTNMGLALSFHYTYRDKEKYGEEFDVLTINSNEFYRK